MPDTWSPSVYLQFADERTRAARDLLAQVPGGTVLLRFPRLFFIAVR